MINYQVEFYKFVNMRDNLALQIYASTVTVSLSSVFYNFTRYDAFWLVFALGGIFIMVGHQIFDQKIKHTLGKILWMVVTSLVVCFFIKILYDEKIISLMSMIISTLVASMIAPATFSIALKDLPAKVAEQILGLPEWFFSYLKRKIDKDGDR